MAGRVDDVESKSVVAGDPSLQTAKTILQNLLFLCFLPANLPNILLSLNVRHLGIDIARVQQYLQSGLFEIFK